METATEFERWEQRFAAPEYVFGTEPNAFLKSQAEMLPKTGSARYCRRRRPQRGLARRAGARRPVG
jgi:hypothetical protein